MAARRPIIVSDLPSIRDVLDEEKCYFCRPGDPENLAEAISRAVDNPTEAKTKAANAYILGQNHSWDKRAERVVGFIRANIAD
jgi:glycosyltransferase involved in cell wall biosynthesis